MRLLLSLTLSLLFFSPALIAKEMSLSSVDAKIAQIQEAESSGGEKSPTLETWKKIKESIGNRLKYEKSSATYQSEIRLAPEELQQLNQKIQEITNSSPPAPDSSLGLDEIEATLSRLKAQIKAHRTQEESLRKAETQRSARIRNLPTEIADAQIALDNLSPPTELGPNASELEQAQYQLSFSKENALSHKLDSLQLEDQLYRATDKLFRAKKEHNQLEIKRLNEQINQWQDTYNKKLTAVTQETLQQAEQQLKQFSHIPVLSSIAQENANLAELRTTLAEKTAKAQQYANTIKEQFTQVSDHFDNAQERINLLKSSGLNIDTKTGELLRKQRASLPTSDTLKIELQNHLVESTNAQIALFDLKQKQQELTPDLKKEARRIWKELGSEQLKLDAVEKLLRDNQALVEGSIQDYDRYIAALHAANKDTKSLIQEVDSYSLYLDERLLWIPSARKLLVGDIFIEQQALTTLFSPQAFQAWWESLKKDLSESTVLWLIFLSLIGVLLTTRKSTNQRFKQMAKATNHRHCTAIFPSVKALFYTILLSQTTAITLAFIAWRVYSPTSLSQGLASAALAISLLGFLKKLSNKNGLLTNHFNLDAEKTHHFHLHCTWMFFSVPAVAFLTSALPLALPTEPQAGRFSFIVLMLLTLAFAHFCFRPSKQINNTEHQSAWISKTIYVLAISTPLVLAIGSALGYISSVHTLASKTLLTLMLIGFTLLLFRFCVRWVLVSRRHLAKVQARQKYKAILAAKKNESDTESASLEEIEANAVDIVSLEEQTRKLLRVAAIVIISLGTWNIWSSTLPALSALDKVTLVSSSNSTAQSSDSSDSSAIPPLIPGVATESTSADTAETTTEATASSGITLKDVLLSLLFIALTVAAARNIPGLLELTILRRIELQPGSCYAITTVLRYTIVAIGALLAFGSIGITWSSVKWLAAAVTLGIGFGLQEIFANFVSGIIILFERPIRLGDVVTIGDISGRVSQIKIRATTIKQFNNRELLVPNKEFITGQLVNWSLCDSLLRFEINVGLAYGSDTELATKLLTEIAKKHPQVLTSPKPEILFTAFGASSLDFQLRGFVDHYNHLIDTQSELHYSIDKAFREANIEIAFPQTDIHIRSLPANAQEILDAQVKE